MVENEGSKWSLGALLRYFRAHGKDTAGEVDNTYIFMKPIYPVLQQRETEFVIRLLKKGGTLVVKVQTNEWRSCRWCSLVDKKCCYLFLT